MLLSRIFGPTLAIQYNAAISTTDQFDAYASTYTFGGCGYLLGIRNCKTMYNYQGVVTAISLIPRLRGGRKAAWYLMFAHA